MTEVGRYIAQNYPRLLTLAEALAFKAVMDAEELARQRVHQVAFSSGAYQAPVRPLKSFGTAPVEELLARGPGEFLRCLAERVLRDHPAEVFLNRCPRCQALARTPQARQCPACHHDWHPGE